MTYTKARKSRMRPTSCFYFNSISDLQNTGNAESNKQDTYAGSSSVVLLIQNKILVAIHEGTRAVNDSNIVFYKLLQVTKDYQDTKKLKRKQRLIFY